MASQVELDRVFLEMATSFAGLSKAIRLKVGCIIVKDGQVISNGFNGTPSGFDNNCEDYDSTASYPGGLITKADVLHAESNALMKLAMSTNSSKGATMYLTCAPCFNCSKLIIQSGVVRVVYSEGYRCLNGVALLKRANIIVEQYKK
jgi:dCMP deaminase